MTFVFLFVYLSEVVTFGVHLPLLASRRLENIVVRMFDDTFNHLDAYESVIETVVKVRDQGGLSTLAPV